MSEITAAAELDAQPTVRPSVEAVADCIAFASGPMGTHYYDYALKAARAVLALIGGRTEREVLAQGWDEGKRDVVNTHPSWWSTLPNPYRQEADHG